MPFRYRCVYVCVYACIIFHLNENASNTKWHLFRYLYWNGRFIIFVFFSWNWRWNDRIWTNHSMSFLFSKKKKQQKKSCAAQKQNRSTFLIDFSLFFFVFLIRNFGRRFESIVREKDRKQIHNLIYIRAGLSLARLIRPMEFITILSNWISLIQMSFDLQIFIFC